MVSHLRTNLVLESLPLLKGQSVGLGNDGNDVDDFTELLHDNNVDRSERMARRVDEVQTAVNTRVLDIAVTLSREFFSEIG